MLVRDWVKMAPSRVREGDTEIDKVRLGYLRTTTTLRTQK